MKTLPLPYSHSDLIEHEVFMLSIIDFALNQIIFLPSLIFIILRYSSGSTIPEWGGRQNFNGCYTISESAVSIALYIIVP